ncbi:MAG: tripartite tricarboxylate transporter substrate binding protein [Pseudomonadota bacterium]
MQRDTRRIFLKRMAAVSASAVAAPVAFGQAAWPTRPIKLIVPYPPGGALDPIARILIDKVSPMLGQPIIIDNRPGATTAIAAGYVNKVEPDGYTLLFTSPSSHIIHTLQQPRGYDPVTGFTPIAAVTRGDYMMTINAGIPAKTLAEFIAWAKAQPDGISAGTSGVGNSDQIVCELFKLVTGVKLVAIPYKGGGPALLDLVGGRTQMMITSQSLQQPQVDAGKLRIMAFMTPSPDRPGAPTMAQAGLQGFETFGLLNIVLGPPNMPQAITDKVTGALKAALDMPAVQSSIAALNQRAFYMPPTALRERMTGDITRLTDIIKRANIQLV